MQALPLWRLIVTCLVRRCARTQTETCHRPSRRIAPAAAIRLPGTRAARSPSEHRDRRRGTRAFRYKVRECRAPAGRRLCYAATAQLPPGFIALWIAIGERTRHEENSRTVDHDFGGLPHGSGAVAQGPMDKFVPVTQENLHNPDPADWPMLGGNMAHWNYSSLDQINRENISSLQLVWARQMPTTGGRAATSPLIHKGIMYLISPNDAIVAVDAVTGSRIWEYRRELPADRARGRGSSATIIPVPNAASPSTATRSSRSPRTMRSSRSMPERASSCGRCFAEATATWPTPAARSLPTAF